MTLCRAQYIHNANGGGAARDAKRGTKTVKNRTARGAAKGKKGQNQQNPYE